MTQINEKTVFWLWQRFRHRIAWSDGGAFAWPRSETCLSVANAASSSSTVGLPLQQAQRTPPSAHYRGRNRPLLRWYQGEELLPVLMQSFESAPPHFSPPPMNPVASCWLDSCLFFVTSACRDAESIAERSCCSSHSLIVPPVFELKGWANCQLPFSSMRAGRLTSLFLPLLKQQASVSLSWY